MLILKQRGRKSYSGIGGLIIGPCPRIRSLHVHFTNPKDRITIGYRVRYKNYKRDKYILKYYKERDRLSTQVAQYNLN